MWSPILRFFKINVASISAFAAMAAVSGAYFLQFGHLGIGDQSKWSEFGSYVGGVVGPLLSFFAFLVLIRSYNKQENDHSVILENGRFFEMLSMLNQMAEGVEVDVITEELVEARFTSYKRVTKTYTGHRGIGRAWNILYNSLDRVAGVGPDRADGLISKYRLWQSIYWDSVESYYDSASFLVDRYVFGDTAVERGYCTQVLKSQMSKNERNIFLLMISESIGGDKRFSALKAVGFWNGCDFIAQELGTALRAESKTS